MFADVDNRHANAQKEILGPALSVIPYSSEDEPVEIDTTTSEYGLDGTAWTSDPGRGVALTRRVASGRIGITPPSTTRSRRSADQVERAPPRAGT
ncbi:aldehyde dehydrogenase family protein [Amycolatopsis mediterranei]|uniref:aldehyde dehydrogenase family protein n=1 Tax=Amycolatopsis mediterranei TaxID=33910 RepID=UPI0034251A1B